MAIRPIPESRDEWLKLRQKFIGASEIAATLGCQAPYQLSPLALHLIKAGKIEASDNSNSRTEDGLAFEAAVAKSVAKMEDWSLKPGVFATDDTTEGLSATLDYVIAPSDKEAATGYVGPGALECKFIQFDQRVHWDGGEPPIWQLVQLQAQLACAGWNWGAVGAWLGGEYIIKRYLRHDFIIEQVRAAATKFWADVRDGRLPKADQYDSTAAALRKLYPRPTPNTVIDLTGDNELPELCIQATKLAATRLAADKEEKRIKNLIREKIGPNETALIAGGIRVKRTVGEETPPRPMVPGEMVPGRKGADNLNINVPKEKPAA